MPSEMLADVDTFKKFLLDPFVGTDILKFGMSLEEVEQLLGPADHVSKNHLGQRVEFRAYMKVGYSKSDDLVSYIGFGRQMEEIYFGDLNLFRTDPIGVLRILGSLDPDPKHYLGLVVFLGLGITLTGFQDQDESQKAVALFEAGYWDTRLGKMTPFDLPS